MSYPNTSDEVPSPKSQVSSQGEESGGSSQERLEAPRLSLKENSQSAMANRTSTDLELRTSDLGLIRNPQFESSIIRKLQIVFLLLFAFCAPLSIAATQICWVLGLVLWAISCAVYRQPRYRRTPLDLPLIAFFALSILSAIASYAPDISVSKLRSVSLLTVAFLFAQNVNSKKLLRALAFVLLASAMLPVAFTLADRAWGRGVRVEKLNGDSPLLAAQIYDGDTILKADNRRVRNLDEVDRALQPASAAANGNANKSSNETQNSNENQTVKLLVYRTEAYLNFELPRGKLLAGATPEARLGVVSWSHGRDQRAMGFYDHYTTFAEALQLIASLALGLLFANFRAGQFRARVSNRLPSFVTFGMLLLLALVSMTAALLLTFTRASWAAFLVSAFVIVLLAARTRRQMWLTGIACFIIAAPLAVAGLYLLHQKRKVGFYDRSDGSILWRETVYREAAHLFTKSPRNFLLGVGMDSIKRYKDEWGMFDHGRLPPGHFHSEPLQIAVERGILTFLVWVFLIVRYLRMLFPLARGEVDEKLTDADYESGLNIRTQNNWIERGIALGAFGGAVGFITSGMVHNNLGDSEVAMIFYFIMGLALVINASARCAQR
jgi:O-antigen ligase